MTTREEAGDLTALEDELLCTRGRDEHVDGDESAAHGVETTAVPPHASASATALSQVRLATKMSEVPAAASDLTVPRPSRSAPSTSTVRPSRPPSCSVARATAAWPTDAMPRPIAVSVRARFPVSTA